MINTGYIGLGNIGKPMCSSLIKARAQNGIAVHVYDVFPEPVQEMLALGGIAAENGKSIAQHCDLIGLCVRDDNDVESLLYGDDGMLANARPNAIIAIHSTVTKDNVLRWAKDGKDAGVHVIDAPITGGAQGAASGELCIMVGSSEDLVARAMPMFAGTSKKVVCGGEIGSGIVLKLAINLINYTSFSAISEALRIVKGSNVSPDKLYEVGSANGVIHPMQHTFITGREGVMAGCTQDEVEQIFKPFLGLAEKDLDHALALAQQLNVEMPGTTAVRSNISDIFLKG